MQRRVKAALGSSAVALVSGLMFGASCGGKVADDLSTAAQRLGVSAQPLELRVLVT
jgi:hypothetical protein